MSESIVSPISGTGTYRVAVPPAAPSKIEENGKPAAESGKVLPPEPEKPDLEAVAEKLNQSTQAIGRDLRFEVNLDSGHSVIQVLDRETGEIIRQIPPEKITPQVQENGALMLRLYDEVV